MRKLGINCPMRFKEIDAIGSVSLIRNAGFDSVFSEYVSDEYCGRLADEIDRAGMSYETIHAPFGNINSIWRSGEEGDNIIKTLKGCLDTCEHYGVPTLIVHLSSGDDAPCVNDIGHARFDRLVEYAGRVGVKIAFENQRKLANIAFAFEVYEKCPQVGFCWDTGHEACFAGGREYMPLFGSRLIALHIHDNMMEHNEDLHLLPFDGMLNFHHIAEQIKKSGYTGTLMLETMHDCSHRYDDLTPQQFFARAYEAAKRLRVLVDGKDSIK